MTSVNLHAVEATLAAEIHGMTKRLDDLLDLMLLEFTVEGWRIEVETTTCTYWHTLASIEVGHITAVTKLDASLGALGMDAVGETLEIVLDLIVNIQLPIE